ncbi:MAG: transcription-repair coupling factor, partial [Deltaproteobacteria bacterium]|nr:transcription-repair coupling factor [Deltaproteobacteria bacterium]
MSALRAGEALVSLTGLKGAARAHVLARLVRSGFGPFVCVTADEEKADELAVDLGFFLGERTASGAPSVLRLPDSEQLPYDALSPERQVAFARLAALFHLSQGTRAAALVLSARALVRRYLPPATLDRHSELVSANQTLDRDELARKLVAMGYQSAPMVEDAGSFAVRGGIVDVWSPLHDKPVRLEFFGDTVESLRLFEPDSQRTAGTLETLLLCPAREVLFDEASKDAGIAAVREAADAVNRPSSKVREMLDGIQEGRLVYGLEALMPGFHHKQLGTLFDYLPKWAKAPLFFIDDPVAFDSALSELAQAMDQEFSAARRREELALEPSAHMLPPEEARRLLAGHPRVLSHAVHLAGPDERSIAFGFGPTAAIRQEILAHHGEHGALTPLVTRLGEWRERGIFAAVACGSSGQADRLKRLLLDRNLMVRVHARALREGEGDGSPFPSEPAAAFEPSVYAHLFSGEISAGFVDPAGSLALLSEEDIFGQRSRKAVRRTRRSDQPFVTAFRELKEGDLVVHVDYGIGRYAGLLKMAIRGIDTDALVLEYAGRDKVYLPVQRMRLLQKFTGADAENVTLDKLGSGSWER